jgi:hypothetical protein
LSSIYERSRNLKEWQINNHNIEFLEEQHLYICDGILVPCVSNILAYKFNDYTGVSREVLQRASEKGTELHQAIEQYEQQGITSDLREFKNYLFLKKQFKFENVSNELPVLYERGGRVLFVGTLDQVITIDGKLGINDFKRVSAPNKLKIAYQLNLYKMAYEQSYGKKIEFLSFTHLRETVRKFHRLPINEETTLSLLNEFLEQEENQCMQ